MSIFEVIQKKKDDKNIVWRYPKRNFNTGSKLIVNESEEALFFRDGESLDLFGPGKYTLSTNNIPLLKRLINIPTGGKSPFTCEVYFIDKTVQQMKWGTPSKLEFLEPLYHFPISIGACGEIRFQIEDSRKLIVKLVGISKNFDSTNVDDFFASQILVKVKSYLTNIIKDEAISIFEIDSKLDKISNELKELLEKEFLDYGIKIEKFFLTNIAKPEDNKQYLQFKELYFKQGVALAHAEIDKQLSIVEAEEEAIRTQKEAEAMAYKRKTEGYTYGEEKGFEIGKEIAKNEAVGQFTNIGVGLGVMSSTSSAIGEKMSKQVAGAFMKTGNICSNCGTENQSGMNFCKKCGNTLLSQTIFCNYCGAKIGSDALFCSKCGKKVQS